MKEESILSKLSVLPALIVWVLYWTWPGWLVLIGILIGAAL